MQRKELRINPYNILMTVKMDTIMLHKKRKTYYGPTLLSFGFRPFFLLAIIFAVTIIPLWVAVYMGAVELNGPFPSVDWHIHEMLFGYTAAVICGFLFTAIPNWTGRMPIRGWPLVMLISLWIAGRLAMAGIGGLRPPLVVLAIDNAFLIAVCGMILIEIVAGRNWRNLKVIIPVVIFLGSNILYHVEVLTQGSAEYSRRLSIAVVVFLITLIGGRIIPSFTRNWLVKSNPGKLPIPFNRFDILCLLASAGSLILWIIYPDAPFAGWLLIIASVLHIVRLLRWRGYRTLSSPLLMMLHVAYSFIPIGLFVLGLGGQTAGLHLLGIGAIGGMTTAVIMRATLGHTGRELKIGPNLVVAFLFVGLAAIIRSAIPFIEIANLSGLEITAILWTLGFGIILVTVGPWLWTTNAKNRTPNKRP
jgi:uncharacterized protein involved in response to NO